MPPKTMEFDRRLSGVWGEFGGQGAYGVRYLQTSVSVIETQKFTLVANIPGSEKWPVRELFQRDISEERVTNDLIPYLKDHQATKFFNPLTIALLPMDGVQPRRELPAERVGEEARDGFAYETAYAAGFYRLSKCITDLAYSQVEWRDDSVKLVAIDGQHRLSALIRMRDELAQNPSDKDLTRIKFESWRIPIVVVVPFPKAKKSEPDILDSIRKLFVSINTSAQIPTRSRRILLTDDELVSVCCQELLDWCHSEKAGSVPLELYDWRSSSESSQGTGDAPMSLMRVDELADIQAEYLIGRDDEDGVERITNEQAAALLMDGAVPKLRKQDAGTFWRNIRTQYRETVMPAVLLVFGAFKPFAEYVEALREMGAGVDDKTKHALSRIRFGKSYEDQSLRTEVDRRFEELCQLCNEEKNKLPEVLRRDVGPRAVFFALGNLKERQEKVKKKTLSWKTFSVQFVDALNAVYKKKWFEKDNKYLRHAAFDPNGGIVNYRLGQVDKGLGCVLALAAGVEMGMEPESGWAEEYLEILESTYLKGFAKEVRPMIEEKNPKSTRSELRDLIHKEAHKRAKKLLSSLRSELKLG